MCLEKIRHMVLWVYLFENSVVYIIGERTGVVILCNYEKFPKTFHMLTKMITKNFNDGGV